MSLRCLTLVAICVVFISTEAVLGEEVKNAVGDTVSFRPDKVVPPVQSIVWKHRNSVITVKAIEWDFEDGFNIPNQRFKGITTLDEKTGQITITNLTVEHSGLYTLNINSKEQEQTFSLTVTGEEVKNVVGVVGGTVSFHPTKVNPAVSSIIWKHRNSSGILVKAIEWDFDDGVSISNQRFKDITTLDEKTGQITITNLAVEHSGLYTLDINSKEQEQRFSLEVMGYYLGGDVKKAVGETVSFRPAKLESPVTSITWKHKTSLTTVKAIEWDFEDGVSIVNQRFKDITTLDEKTGEITITNLKVEHSGDYTIDINSKEQEQKFSLEVMERVPKPVITTEESSNPDVVYLRCGYTGTIIWMNSAGAILEGTKNHKPGEYIKVENTRNPENYYTCTLKNAVSEETSEPVYERELFVTESVPWWIVLIVLFVLILLAAPFVLYKVCKPFHDFVYKNFGEKTCIRGILNCLDGRKNPLNTPSDAENVKGLVYEKTETDPLNNPRDAKNVEDSDYVNAETDGDKQEGAENSNGPGIKEDSTLSESRQ